MRMLYLFVNLVYVFSKSESTVITTVTVDILLYLGDLPNTWNM